MDSFYQGVIKGIGVDIDPLTAAGMSNQREAERKNAKRNKRKSAKDYWLLDYLEKDGRYPALNEIKRDAIKGHPDLAVHQAATEFQNRFGKMKLRPIEIDAKQVALPYRRKDREPYDAAYMKWMDALLQYDKKQKNRSKKKSK